jgi:DUF1365 family protein
MPMDMRYQWCFSAPSNRLFVNIQNFKEGEHVFDATLALRQEPITARALTRLLIGFPLMTLKVIIAIHWEALQLWRKRTPFHSHPRLAARRAP